MGMVIAAGSNAKYRTRVMFKVQVCVCVCMCLWGRSFHLCKQNKNGNNRCATLPNDKMPFSCVSFFSFGFPIVMRKCFSMYVHMCVCGTKENLLINKNFLNAIRVWCAYRVFENLYIYYWLAHLVTKCLTLLKISRGIFCWAMLQSQWHTYRHTNI